MGSVISRLERVDVRPRELRGPRTVAKGSLIPSVWCLGWTVRGVLDGALKQDYLTAADVFSMLTGRKAVRL